MEQFQNKSESLLGHRTRRPDLSFRSDGRIEIKARVSKILDLHPGDVIDILADGEEYYLYVRLKSADAIGRHEAQCYPSNNSTRCHNLRCYSKRLCTKMLMAAGCPDKAVIFAGRVVDLKAVGKAIIVIPHSSHLYK